MIRLAFSRVFDCRSAPPASARSRIGQQRLFGCGRANCPRRWRSSRRTGRWRRQRSWLYVIASISALAKARVNFRQSMVIPNVIGFAQTPPVTYGRLEHGPSIEPQRRTSRRGSKSAPKSWEIFICSRRNYGASSANKRSSMWVHCVI